MITDYTLMGSLNNVERWGTIPHLRRQTVAAHSFDVCWTIDWIIENVLQGKISAEDWRRCMRWALRHDMTEGLTGDIPSPPKRLGMVKEDMTSFHDQYPKTGNLGDPDPKSAALIKLADRLCMLRDAAAEYQMGNTVFKDIQIKCIDLATIAYAKFRNEWEEANFSSGSLISKYLSECPPLTAISHIIEKDME